jgi:4-hydroxy-3-polyprenylbenzoate decarboxylase
LNAGSKVVIAAVGARLRTLGREPPALPALPDGFKNPLVALPGVLVLRGPKYIATSGREPADLPRLTDALRSFYAWQEWPLIVVVDDADFATRTINNFLWSVFTRSNPAADVHGVDPFTEQKHWGCRGPLVIDSRIKPWHAPPLVENLEVSRRVDALAAKNGPLARYL